MELPMFPLSTVVFPGAGIPLRVFEPRYLRLVDDVTAGAGRFGTVLIERGSEVGGGDTRFGIGTELALAGSRSLGDGEVAIVAVGVRRIRIERWLDEIEYPRAEVTPLARPADGTIDLTDARHRTVTARALLSETGADTGTDLPDLAPDPILALDQLCSLAPVTDLDRQRLLEIETPAEQLRELTALLDETIEALRRSLGG